MDSSCFLIWNVRGLNDRVKRDSVKSLVVDIRPSIICLQETKLCSISDFDVLSILGSGFSNFVYSPAIGTIGGCWYPGVMELFHLWLQLSSNFRFQLNCKRKMVRAGGSLECMVLTRTILNPPFFMN
jgi:exonuclease III